MNSHSVKEIIGLPENHATVQPDGLQTSFQENSVVSLQVILSIIFEGRMKTGVDP